MIETKKPKKYMKKEDYIGKKFGKLTVIEFDHYGAKSTAFFKCQCECGNLTVVSIAGLKSGNNKSCGCLHDEHIKTAFPKYRKDQYKHGYARSRLYKIWSSMKSRCSIRNKEYTKNYGDRGISVCEEWDDFETFKDWALSNGYDESLTIDRIDVNGNYEPSNCRWADEKTQGRNRRNTLYVDFEGKKMSLKDACDLADISYHTAYGRMRYRGVSLHKALYTKPSKGRKIHE